MPLYGRWASDNWIYIDTKIPNIFFFKKIDFGENGSHLVIFLLISSNSLSGEGTCEPRHKFTTTGKQKKQGFLIHIESWKDQLRFPLILIELVVMETLQWSLGLVLKTLEVSGTPPPPNGSCQLLFLSGSDHNNSLSHSVNLEWTWGEQQHIPLMLFTPILICMANSRPFNPFYGPICKQ